MYVASRWADWDSPVARMVLGCRPPSTSMLPGCRMAWPACEKASYATASLEMLRVPYRPAFQVFSRSTPTLWADTPTQAYPERSTCSQAKNQRFSASKPLVTLDHSTSTVPLNRDLSAGRRTTMRVL